MSNDILKVFKIVSALFLSFHVQQVTAQTDSLTQWCGSNYFHSIYTDSFRRPPPPAPGTPGGAGPAMQTCGVIDVYYDDISMGTSKGFDDTTIVGSTSLGAQRVATFCDLLNDLQATFDFSSISPSSHLAIHVKQSLDDGSNRAVAGDTWLAQSSPSRDTIPIISAGYFNQYVTTGTDPSLGLYYHGFIKVNFDQTISPSGHTGIINWQNDHSVTPNCKSDLYSILLHEMGHIMGWITVVNFSWACCQTSCGCIYPFTPYKYTTLANTGTANQFTKLDTAIAGGPTGSSNSLNPSLLQHLVISSGGGYIINPSAYDGYSNYWINDRGAPDNDPVFSGLHWVDTTIGPTGSFFSHLDDQFYTYSFRERISPGDRQDYVMSPVGRDGSYKRSFTKGEIRTFVQTLGYTLKSSFVTAHPNIYNNHLPYSQKMAGLNINENTYQDFTEDSSTIDDTMTNNTGSSITISISNLMSSGDLTDADGDSITIDTASIINFRGSGIGWNNHACLSWSGAHPTSIVYTPRSNFYGKAQFGFNVYDGKEKGSFRVITIEVKRGNNVSPTFSSGNLICNGDFEEGSEMKVAGNDGIPNTYVSELPTVAGISPFAMEGKWQGVSFSDSHPYEFHSNQYIGSYQFIFISGCIVGQSNIQCNGTVVTGKAGHETLSFPDSTISFHINNPNPPSGGHRYQKFNGYSKGESYYYLNDNISKCGRYVLSFDMQLPNEGWGPLGNYRRLNIGLGDSTGVYQHRFHYIEASHSFTVTGGTGWQRVTDTILYCNDTASNILYLHNNDDGNSFNIDNMSLTLLALPTMSVTIAATKNPIACQETLTPTITAQGCTPTQYLWAGPGLSCTTCASPIVPEYATLTTYTLTVSDACSGRTASDTISINPTDSIAGNLMICSGTTTTLSNATPGGAWTSSNTAIARVTSGTSIVTGVSGGTATITYTTGRGCITTKVITVYATPPAISSPGNVCVGLTALMSDALPGGIWSSSVPATGTIDATTGVFTAIAAGITLISYTMPGSGCATFVSQRVVVTPVAITGPTSVCAGSTISMTDATTGGVWGSSNAGVASVNSSGAVTGVAAGTATISYVTGSGCFATETVTVLTTPTITTTTSGICVADAETYSATPTGGTWSSSNPGVAPIDITTGMVIGYGPGTTVITYTLGSCIATKTITVALFPSVTGSTSVCLGASTVFSTSPTGGAWTSSNTTIATVSGGTVNGIAVGTTTLTYLAGCPLTFTFTVAPIPTLSGTTTVCLGSTAVLSTSVTGGTWTSTNTLVATVNSSTGVYTGVNITADTIVYETLAGCRDSITILVLSVPSAITGTTAVCIGSGATLSASPTGGTWSSSNTSVATIGSTSGTYTSVGAGTTTISYTKSNGCSATKTVTINPLPGPIGGPLTICVGASGTLSDASTGGTWSSSSTTGTIGSSTGLVTGVAAGTMAITYTLPTGCTTDTIITIQAPPAAITGTMTVCVSSTTALTDATTGGGWLSGNTSVATVGLTSGIVTGVSAGTAIISYIHGVCAVTATVTVNPLPVPIIGPSLVCVGNMVTLSDATSGGTWTSSSTAASVSAVTGIVVGVSAGTTTITYALSTGCYATYSMTVGAAVDTIAGPKAVCSATPVTLTETTTGGVWSSSITTIATIGSGSGIVTAVSSGTTTISYVVSVGCYTSNDITIVNGSCDPCSVFPAGFQVLSGSFLPSLSTGSYYIDNTINIAGPGTTTLSGAVILMGTGAKIIVESTATLVLDGTHIFSCGMWPGIEVTTLGLNTGKIRIANHSLIEDADVAVSMKGAQKPGSGYLIESDNAIFNRNYKGIYIETYTDNTATYPFLIRNTVFTSRDLAPTMTPTLPYPANWPDNNGMYGLKAIYTPPSTDIFTPPLNIDNPIPSTATASGIVTYNPTTCKNGAIPYCGIQLENVGAEIASGTLAGGTPVPSAYYDIAIGDDAYTAGNVNENLFDYMNVGIFAINSNLTCLNNTFTHMIPLSGPIMVPLGGSAAVIPPSGDGIYAAAANDYWNHKRLQVFTSPGGGAQHNRFYSFLNGVESYNYYHIDCRNNYMINKPFPAIPFMPTTPSGLFGYKVSTPTYELVDISNNAISNVDNGIGMWALVVPLGALPAPGPGGAPPPQQYTGDCRMIQNKIHPRPDTLYTAITTEEVKTGIAIQNVLTPYRLGPLGTYFTPSSAFTGQMQIRGNEVAHAYNGIYSNNWFYQPTGMDHNEVYMRPIKPIRRVVQYGINNTHGYGLLVYDNLVTGSEWPMDGYDSIKAIFTAACSKASLSCNSTQNTGRGFEFFHNNPRTSWGTNWMDRNGKGMILNIAVIGQQGTPANPSENTWSNSSWWTGTHWHTYEIQSDTRLDTLWVNPSAIKNPGHNDGKPPSIAYSTTYGSVQTTTSSVVPMICPPVFTDGELSTYISMVRQDIPYAENIIPTRWMSQYATWESIMVDSVLLDTASVLQKFDSMAALSRYSLLTSIEGNLAFGDYATADSLLASGADTIAHTDTDAVTGVRLADSVGANQIVQNYMQFYKLYRKYVDVSLTIEDSTAIMALAQLCPHTNGTVVYQARALYSFIYNDITVYNDDSCVGLDTTYFAGKHGNANPDIPKKDRGIVQTHDGQQYELYPNPSHGIINLKQHVKDELPVHAEIWNAVGVSLYRKDVVFNGQGAQIRLAHVIPGLYLLKLTDSRGREFIFRFVEE